MPKSPLQQSQMDAVASAQRILHDLVPLIANLEQCGTDCSGFKDKVQEYYDTLQEIVKRFGPNGLYEQGKY